MNNWTTKILKPKRTIREELFLFNKRFSFFKARELNQTLRADTSHKSRWTSTAGEIIFIVLFLGLSFIDIFWVILVSDSLARLSSSFHFLCLFHFASLQWNESSEWKRERGQRKQNKKDKEAKRNEGRVKGWEWWIKENKQSEACVPLPSFVFLYSHQRPLSHHQAVTKGLSSTSKFSGSCVPTLQTLPFPTHSPVPFQHSSPFFFFFTFNLIQWSETKAWWN